MKNATQAAEKKSLTVKEAARRLGVNPETIKRAIRAGELRANRLSLGERYVLLIDAADLDAMTKRGPGRPRKEKDHAVQ